MSILSYDSLIELLPTVIKDGDPHLVNPASIDIRIGSRCMYQLTGHNLPPEWVSASISEGMPLWVDPGELVLIETLEHITVPDGYAMDLRLKSSMARRGWQHSLAFWVDPGWSGVLTMEIQNISKGMLGLRTGERFGQVILHELDHPAGDHAYNGRYQGATSVEGSKP